MTSLVSEVIQHAIRQGLQAVHLSVGNDVSKTRWGTSEVCYLSGVELAPRRSAGAIYLAYTAAARVGRGKLARALAPAVFIRRSRAVADQQPSTVRSLVHTIAAAAAVLVILDLLDGIMDGMLHFFPLPPG